MNFLIFLKFRAIFTGYIWHYAERTDSKIIDMASNLHKIDPKMLSVGILGYTGKLKSPKIPLYIIDYRRP